MAWQQSKCRENVNHDRLIFLDSTRRHLNFNMPRSAFFHHLHLHSRTDHVVASYLIFFLTEATTVTMKIGSSIVLAVAFASNVAAFAPAQLAATRSSIALHMATDIDDKTEVREYFNSEGFNRWNKIYSESDDVNSVQLDIRDGHDQTIQKILNWIQDDGDIAGKTVCDCGCGVGSLAIPLAQMGK